MYRCTNVWVYKCMGVQDCTTAQVCKCLGVHMYSVKEYGCTGVQMYGCTGVQVYGCASIWVCKYMGVQV